MRELDQKTAALALQAFDHALLITRRTVSAAARKMFVPRSTVQRVKGRDLRVNFYAALRDPKFGESFIRKFCREYVLSVRRGRR